MKNLSLVISIVALAGVIALAFLKNKQPNETLPSNDEIEAPAQKGDLKIAYINSDSVLVNYQLAIDLNENFVKKQKEFTEEFGQKRAEFEQDAIKFQEKVQSGGFLTQERAVRERDRILGQEEEIKRLDYELSNKLAGLEAEINKQLVDSIVNYVKIYNKKHNYTFVLNNSGIIIDGKARYNISKDIIEGLNARYNINED